MTEKTMSFLSWLYAPVAFNTVAPRFILEVIASAMAWAESDMMKRARV